MLFVDSSIFVAEMMKVGWGDRGSGGGWKRRLFRIS